MFLGGPGRWVLRRWVAAGLGTPQVPGMGDRTGHGALPRCRVLPSVAVMERVPDAVAHILSCDCPFALSSGKGQNPNPSKPTAVVQAGLCCLSLRASWAPSNGELVHCWGDNSSCVLRAECLGFFLFRLFVCLFLGFGFF